MGFEPTRAEPIGLAVQRLNHSATSSIGNKRPWAYFKYKFNFHLLKIDSHAGSWTRACWVKASYPSR